MFLVPHMVLAIQLVLVLSEGEIRGQGRWKCWSPREGWRLWCSSSKACAG